MPRAALALTLVLLLALAMPTASAGPLARAGGGVVITFDDGCVSALNAATALEARGMHGTFYIISSPQLAPQNDCPYLSPSQVVSLDQRGEDVEAHTVSHPDLTTLSSSQLTHELADSQTALQNLLGHPVRHMAYPYGATDPTVTAEAAKYYDSARLYYSDFSAMPLDDEAHILPAIGVLNTTTTTDVSHWLSTARAANDVLILVFHDIRADPERYQSTPAMLNATLDLVKASGLPVMTIAQLFGTSGTPPPSSTGTFSASFNPDAANEWWIQVHVTTATPLAGVGASINGGAPQPLALKSYGDWAASYHAPSGSVLQFIARATTGATATSGCYLWTSRAPTTCPGGGTITLPPILPPPSNSSFTASFTNVRGNEWWIESNVAASGGTLAGVDARVNGGAWTALSHTSWGSWAKSIHAVTGSKVEFRARSTSGATAQSAVYSWPPG